MATSPGDTNMMMPDVVRSWLKTTPLYFRHFARTHALALDTYTKEESRQARLYGKFVRTYPMTPIVFDVGANIGKHSKLFRRLGCHVVAIEPQRACIAALERTFGTSIKIVHAAVSDSIGSADLQACGFHTVASMSRDWIETTTKNGRFPGLVWDKKERVQTTTIDALIQTHGFPCFIKIDVEGYELQVLRGLSRPVPALCFEVHPETAKIAIDCVSRLGELGRYEFNYSGDDDATLEFSDWLDPEHAVGYLATIERRGDVYARLRPSSSTN